MLRISAGLIESTAPFGSPAGPGMGEGPDDDGERGRGRIARRPRPSGKAKLHVVAGDGRVVLQGLAQNAHRPGGSPEDGTVMFPPEGPRRSVEDFLGGRGDGGEPSRPGQREDPDAHGFGRLLEEVAQKNRPTTERKSSSVRTPTRWPRNVEAPGIPRLYQARCFR